MTVLSLFAAINALPANRIEEIRLQAKAEQQDFYTLVAAHALNVKYAEITLVQRKDAKMALFSSTYSTHGFLGLRRQTQQEEELASLKTELRKLKGEE